MLSYTHFTLEERKYLQKLLSEGLILRKAAAVLERGAQGSLMHKKRRE